VNYQYTYGIECAILATLLTTEKILNQDDVKYFEFDPGYFADDFNKLIATKIKEYIDAGKSLSLLETKLEAWIRDTKPEYAQRWFKIIGVFPLPMSVAEAYYKDIKDTEIERKINAIR
jgi:hypothetical protein